MSSSSSVPSRIQDAQFDIKSMIVPPMLQSAANVAYHSLIPSGHDSSETTWTYQLNKGDALSRRIRVQADVKVTLAKTGGGASCVEPGKSGWRSYPLQGAVNIATLTLNNYAIQSHPAREVRHLTRYNLSDHVHGKLYASTSSGLHDKFQKASDGYGKMINPIGSYGDTAVVSKRTSIEPVSVSTGNTDSAFVATYRITEDLIMPGLKWTEGVDNNAFTHIKTLELRLNWAGDLLKKMWIHDGADALLAASTIEVLTPKLILQTFQPPAGTTLPGVAMYPFYKISRTVHPHQGVSIAAPTSDTALCSSEVLNSSLIPLQGIPEKIFIWASRKESDISGSQSLTDTYLSCNNISITFDGRPSLLSRLTPNQLYARCVQTGLNQDFQEFSGRTFDYLQNKYIGLAGSVLCIRPGVDFPIVGDKTVGMKGGYSMNIEGTFRNTHPTLAVDNPELNVLVVYPGVLATNKEGATQASFNTVLPKDFNNRSSSGRVRYFGNNDATMGGGFWNDLVKGFPKGMDLPSKVIRTATKAVKKGKTLVKDVTDFQKAFTGGKVIAGTEMGGSSCQKNIYSRFHD